MFDYDKLRYHWLYSWRKWKKSKKGSLVILKVCKRYNIKESRWIDIRLRWICGYFRINERYTANENHSWLFLSYSWCCVSWFVRPTKNIRSSKTDPCKIHWYAFEYIIFGIEARLRTFFANKRTKQWWGNERPSLYSSIKQQKHLWMETGG